MQSICLLVVDVVLEIPPGNSLAILNATLSGARLKLLQHEEYASVATHTDRTHLRALCT